MKQFFLSICEPKTFTIFFIDENKEIHTSKLDTLFQLSLIEGPHISNRLKLFKFVI